MMGGAQTLPSYSPIILKTIWLMAHFIMVLIQKTYKGEKNILLLEKKKFAMPCLFLKIRNLLSFK
jgi:hypothetical protein